MFGLSCNVAVLSNLASVPNVLVCCVRSQLQNVAVLSNLASVPNVPVCYVRSQLRVAVLSNLEPFQTFLFVVFGLSCALPF